MLTTESTIFSGGHGSVVAWPVGLISFTSLFGCDRVGTHIKRAISTQPNMSSFLYASLTHAQRKKKHFLTVPEKATAFFSGFEPLRTHSNKFCLRSNIAFRNLSFEAWVLVAQLHVVCTPTSACWMLLFRISAVPGAGSAIGVFRSCTNVPRFAYTALAPNPGTDNASEHVRKLRMIQS